MGNLPDSLVVKNPPASAEDKGSIPGQEPAQAMGQLNPCTTITGAHVLQLLKPTCPRAHALQQEKSPQWEAHVLQPEKACAHQWRPGAAKNKK